MAIKVTVGQTTFVKKIVVGTPVSTAVENLSIDAFTDFNVATKSDGQILVYDSSESAFKNFDFVTGNGIEKFYTPGNDKLLIQIDSSSTPVVTGLSTQGNIVPTADSSFDLGDSEKKFKDLYLSGGTIHLGGIDLKDSNGTFGAKDSTGAAVNFDLSGSIQVKCLAVVTLQLPVICLMMQMLVSLVLMLKTFTQKLTLILILILH